jgi:hypothetical protein
MSRNWYYKVRCQFFESIGDVNSQHPSFKVIGEHLGIIKHGGERGADTYDVFKQTEKGEVLSHVINVSSFGIDLRDTCCRTRITSVVIDGKLRAPTIDEQRGKLFDPEPHLLQITGEVSSQPISAVAMGKMEVSHLPTVNILDAIEDPICIWCSNHPYYVHSFVVKCRWPTLDWESIEHYSQNVMELLIQYLYTGIDGIKWSNTSTLEVVNLVEILHLYENTKFLAFCNKWLQDNLTVDLLHYTIRVVDKKKLIHTRPIVMNLIHRNMKTFLNDPKFTTLNDNLIEELRAWNNEIPNKLSIIIQNDPLLANVEHMKTSSSINMSVEELIKCMKYHAAKFVTY